MQSPEAGAGWGWCLSMPGEHDPISQQWHASVCVQALRTASWLLAPCGNNGSQNELGHCQNWWAPIRCIPDKEEQTPGPISNLLPPAQCSDSCKQWGTWTCILVSAHCRAHQHWQLPVVPL